MIQSYECYEPSLSGHARLFGYLGKFKFELAKIFEGYFYPTKVVGILAVETIPRHTYCLDHTTQL